MHVPLLPVVKPYSTNNRAAATAHCGVGRFMVFVSFTRPEPGLWWTWLEGHSAQAHRGVWPGFSVGR